MLVDRYGQPLQVAGTGKQVAVAASDTAWTLSDATALGLAAVVAGK